MRYVCSERKDNRAPMLRRTFLRGLVRQMGSPAVLAATYSNNTEQMASAAVNELQEALVSLPAHHPRRLSVLFEPGRLGCCFATMLGPRQWRPCTLPDTNGVWVLADQLP